MGLLQVGIVVLVWLALAALVVAFAMAAGRADRREARQRVTRESTPRPALLPEPGRVAMRSRRSHAAVTPQRARAAG